MAGQGGTAGPPGAAGFGVERGGRGRVRSFDSSWRGGATGEGRGDSVDGFWFGIAVVIVIIMIPLGSMEVISPA